jgi:hypothetical protein
VAPFSVYTRIVFLPFCFCGVVRWRQPFLALTSCERNSSSQFSLFLISYSLLLCSLSGKWASFVPLWQSLVGDVLLSCKNMWFVAYEGDCWVKRLHISEWRFIGVDSGKNIILKRYIKCMSVEIKNTFVVFYWFWLWRKWPCSKNWKFVIFLIQILNASIYP